MPLKNLGEMMVTMIISLLKLISVAFTNKKEAIRKSGLLCLQPCFFYCLTVEQFRIK